MMQSQFGDIIGAHKEHHYLSLLPIAPHLAMDTAQLSKIEKGFLQIKGKQLPNIAEILKGSSDELRTLWLADQIYTLVKDEKQALQALMVTEGEVKKLNKKSKQNNLTTDKI